MTTTADRKLDEAAGAVKQAIKSLHDVVVEECHGHDEYYQVYREMLHDVYGQLIDIKKRLNR